MCLVFSCIGRAKVTKYIIFREWISWASSNSSDKSTIWCAISRNDLNVDLTLFVIPFKFCWTWWIYNVVMTNTYELFFHPIFNHPWQYFIMPMLRCILYCTKLEVDEIKVSWDDNNCEVFFSVFFQFFLYKKKSPWWCHVDLIYQMTVNKIFNLLIMDIVSATFYW